MDIDSRGLIASLTATPATLAHLVAEVPEARLDWSEVPGGWAPRTLLAHFRDDEYLCMRPNLELMLALDTPQLRFVDGDDAWEQARNRTRDRKEVLLGDFALQRQATLGILRMLRPEDWERGGLASGHPLSVAKLVERWAQHDAEHIAGLEAALGETLLEVVARRARPE